MCTYLVVVAESSLQLRSCQKHHAQVMPTRYRLQLHHFFSDQQNFLIMFFLSFSDNLPREYDSLSLVVMVADRSRESQQGGQPLIRSHSLPGRLAARVHYVQSGPRGNVRLPVGRGLVWNACTYIATRFDVPYS